MPVLSRLTIFHDVRDAHSAVCCWQQMLASLGVLQLAFPQQLQQNIDFVYTYVFTQLVGCVQLCTKTRRRNKGKSAHSAQKIQELYLKCKSVESTAL